jgi:hypothetical protein
MKTIDLRTWEEFEAEVAKLNTFLSGQKRHEFDYVARPLFRGQSRASWELETSLERYLRSVVSIEQYNRYLLRIKPAVEAYTERSWKVEREIKIEEDTTFHSVPNYEFMLYARHHGFPSPLLDWSQSPYVALFFAFQNAVPGQRVSVFAYVDDIGSGKGGWVGSPQISALGPYVSSHRRHFMQQSQYTIATEKVKDEWVYCSHEKYFSGTTDESQDLLIKFTLPGELRNKYLQKLQQMNINAFTLYGTDESLMDMLAFREIIERNSNY